MGTESFEASAAGNTPLRRRRRSPGARPGLHFLAATWATKAGLVGVGVGVSSPEPPLSRGRSTRHLYAPAAGGGGGVSGLDPLPGELTASKSAGGSRGSTRKEWRPASPGFLKALHLLAQARVRIKMGGPGQPPSITLPNRGFPGRGAGGERSGGLPGALRARASSRHTKSPGREACPSPPFLQGTLHRPGAPRPGLPAVQGRAAASSSPRDAEGVDCPTQRPTAYPSCPELRAAPWHAPERVPCSQSASPSWQLGV